MKSILLLILLTISSVSNGDEGQWVPKEKFMQANVFCYRIYTCEPSKDYLHSVAQKIMKTKKELVEGVCIVGGGAIDTCQCVTAPPKSRCEIKFISK